MSDSTQGFDLADAIASAKSTPDVRLRVAAVALSGASVILPFSSNAWVTMLFVGSGGKNAVYALAAATLAALAATGIAALRDHVRQFDLAVGAVSAFIALKLAYLALFATGAAIVTEMNLGTITLLVAVGLGIFRGFHAIQRPLHE